LTKAASECRALRVVNASEAACSYSLLTLYGGPRTSPSYSRDPRESSAAEGRRRRIESPPTGASCPSVVVDTRSAGIAVSDHLRGSPSMCSCSGDFAERHTLHWSTCGCLCPPATEAMAASITGSRARVEAPASVRWLGVEPRRGTVRCPATSPPDRQHICTAYSPRNDHRSTRLR